MTRENKAGLAIAGVFLTLVGMVGVMKWRDAPGQRTVAMSVPPAVASGPGAAAREVPKAPETPKVAERTKLPETPKAPNPGAMPTVDAIEQSGGTKSTPTIPATVTPSPGAPPPGVPLEIIDPKAGQEGGGIPIVRGPPAPPLSPGVLQVKGENTAALPGLPGVSPTPPAVSPTPPPDVNLVLPENQSTAPANFPLPGAVGSSPPATVEQPKVPATPIPSVVTPPKGDSPVVAGTPPVGVEIPKAPASALPGDAPSPPGNPFPPATPPAPVKPPTPVPANPTPMSSLGATDIGPPSPPTAGSPALEPMPPVGGGSGTPPPPLEPKIEAAIPTNPPPPAPLPVKVTEKTSSGTVLEPSRFVPAVVIAAPRPQTPAPTPRADLESTADRDSGLVSVKPPVGSPPPQGLRPVDKPPSEIQFKPVPPAQANESRSTLPSSTLPSARTPVVQVGGAGESAKGTKVIRYDTLAHPCRTGDTWESISKKHLISDKWAEALRAFNTQYRGQDQRVRDSGVIQAGDTVFVPSAQELLDKFPTLIRK